MMRKALIMMPKLLTFALVALFLSACGPASPYVIDQPQPDEMKPGGGLFSGDDGEFVIYGSSPAGPGSPPPEASLEGGVAATTEVPEGLIGDHENARYADEVFPRPGEDDSEQEAPAAN